MRLKPITLRSRAAHSTDWVNQVPCLIYLLFNLLKTPQTRCVNLLLVDSKCLSFVLQHHSCNCHPASIFMRCFLGLLLHSHLWGVFSFLIIFELQLSLPVLNSQFLDFSPSSFFLSCMWTWCLVPQQPSWDLEGKAKRFTEILTNHWNNARRQLPPSLLVIREREKHLNLSDYN